MCIIVLQFAVKRISLESYTGNVVANRAPNSNVENFILSKGTPEKANCQAMGEDTQGRNQMVTNTYIKSLIKMYKA